MHLMGSFSSSSARPFVLASVAMVTSKEPFCSRSSQEELQDSSLDDSHALVACLPHPLSVRLPSSSAFVSFDDFNAIVVLHAIWQDCALFSSRSEATPVV